MTVSTLVATDEKCFQLSESMERIAQKLAFESLAVMSNALTRLEAGDLGICSFGETVQLLHPFHEPSPTNQVLKFCSNSRLIRRTKIAQTVQKAVRFARQANIFMVFVILDNPANKDSILDIRFPIFRPSEAAGN
ncbi:Midasin [Acropora cervicornis]|uniref:Midasin n=1 Tax=Acropora cervicornis TaxID=6130 RepID=A0AAD9PS84_ACRCE|nr:Midasin [Acropora cervicornis]